MQLTQFYVYKRPHVDHFLSTVAQWYDIVVFTASLGEYANPVIDALDRGQGVVPVLLTDGEGGMS